MEFREGQGKKPESIAQAQSILYFCFIASSIEFVYSLFTKEHSVDRSIQWVALLGTVFLLAWWFTIYEIGKGKNWARFLYVAAFVALTGNTLFIGYQPSFLYDPILWSLRKTFEILGIFMLFQKDSRLWLGKRDHLSLNLHDQMDVEDIAKQCLNKADEHEVSRPILILKYGSLSYEVLKLLAILLVIYITLGITASTLYNDRYEGISYIHVPTIVILYAMCFNLILIKEVQIFPDKALKIWGLIGSREVRFKDASVRGSTFVFTKTINIYNENHGILARGVIVTGNFLEEGDFQRFKEILSDLSGRPLSEFSQFKFKMSPFLNVGETHADR
jgi:hypothetical protein